MSLFIVSLVLICVIVIGVRTIRGTWSPADNARDIATVERWRRAKKKGFVVHCFTRVLPLAAAYCVLAPATRSWWKSGVLSYPVEDVGLYAVLAAVFTLIVGAFTWKIMDSAAAEAVTRLQNQNQ
jgi:hypothetical protein